MKAIRTQTPNFAFYCSVEIGVVELIISVVELITDTQLCIEIINAVKSV